MDLEKLRAVWQSPGNVPSAAEVQQVKTRFTRSLQSRHRIFIGFLVWVFSALALCTGVVLYNFLITHKLSLERDWAALPLLAVPWLFALGFLFQFRRHHRAHSRYGDSIVNALRAALDENRLARSRTQRLGWIYLAGLPALALAIHQLQQAGKMQGNEALSMVVIFGAAIATAGGWAAVQYYRKLLPEKAEIEALLRQYDAE